MDWYVDDAVKRAQLGGRTTPADIAAARTAGFQTAVKEFDELLPKSTPHPTDPRYTIVQRGPKSPDWMPEVNLRPVRELDHNGAFHQSGRLKPAAEQKSLADWAPGNAPEHRWMGPEQLVVDGKQLTNMDGVMVFSGHGGRGSFEGLSTKQAAKMAAEQVADAQKRGKTIDKCVLDACHQRDRRWLFGSSNAQAFQRELNAELKKLGVTHDVKVLAADKGGPLWGTNTKSYWTGKKQPARYTPASDGARLYMTKGDLIMAGLGTAAAAEAAAIGYFVYRALSDDE